MEQLTDMKYLKLLAHEYPPIAEVSSEIINLKAVRSFDLSRAGTIRVALKNGEAAYVSRRYVAKIKEALGM